MSNLYENKKHFSEFASGLFIIFAVGMSAYLFGHWKGRDKVQKEAIDYSYGTINKDGFQWKSKQLVMRGR